MQRIGPFFEAWASFMWDRHQWVALVAIVMAISCPVLLRGLHFKTLTDTPLSDAKAGSDYQDGISRFGESSPLIVALTRNTTTTALFDSFTDSLADELRAWSDIPLVQSHVLPRESRGAGEWRLGVVLANSGTATAQALTERLSRKGMHKQLRRSRKRLLMAGSSVEREIIAQDLLDVGGLLSPFYAARAHSAAMVPSLYFDAPDGDSRLVFVYPAVPAEDAPYSQNLLARVRETAEHLKESLGAHDIDVAYTGRHALSGEGTMLLQKELVLITLIAGGLLFVLFWSVFRSIVATLLCGLPIAVAMSAVLVVICLFFNPIDMFAMGFAAIILGLAIDVTIHCVGRLHQMLECSCSVREATIRTLGDCGPPVAIGMTTTAAAFLCMGFAHYSGVRQFGFVAASGILLSLVTSLAVFPASVRWIYGRTPPARTGLRYHLLPRHLFGIAFLHPRRALALAAVILVLSIAAAAQFRFDMRIETTLPATIPAMETATEISRQHGTAFAMSTYAWIKAPSLTEAMRGQRTLDAFLCDAVEDGQVAGFESPSILLRYPPDEAGDAGSGAVAVSRDTVKQDFLATLQALGFEASHAQSEYIDTIVGAVQTLHRSPTWPTDTDLHPHINRLAIEEGGDVYLQTIVWPPGDMNDMGAVKELSAAIRTLEIQAPVEISVSSSYEAYEEANSLVRSDFIHISLIAMGVVSLMVFLYFRKTTAVLLALLPMGAAIPFTLGFLHITGRPFTPSGIGLIALLIGIGIDDAVHILTRVREPGNAGITGMLNEIGPVLTLTTVSSMIGFGALLVSQYQTISILGFAVAVGVAASLFFTFLIIPACLAFHPRRKGIGTVLIVLLTCGIAFPAKASDEDGAMKIIRRLQKRYEGAQTISCRFEQRKHIAQLSHEIRLSGIMLFQQPAFLRLELRGDENLNLWADNQRAWIHDLDLEEVESYGMTGGATADRVRDLLPLVYNHSPTDLPKQFDISLQRTEDGLDRLTLSPKPGTVVAWKETDLDIDRWGRMRRMACFYSEFDYVTVTFLEWKRLKPLEPSMFNYVATSNTPLLKITALRLDPDDPHTEDPAPGHSAVKEE